MVEEPQMYKKTEKERRDQDYRSLLACESHLGSNNMSFKMRPYVVSRPNSTNLINIKKTYEKILLAARIIFSIDNPADVVVISARPYGGRPILKFSQYTGALAIAGRWTPGTLTNQITKEYIEPRLLIATDPRLDKQAIKECAYSNVPVIALCNTDSPLEYVDVAIPCNNKGKHSIALIYWMLAREVLYLREAIPRDQPWEVLPDMFFWRDPEDYNAKNEAETAEASTDYYRNEPVQDNIPQPDWSGTGPQQDHHWTGQNADWSATGLQKEEF